MADRQTKYWIGVACKEHVEKGMELGICQFCHGKSSPVRCLKSGDFVIYYSSKVAMGKPELYQKFTAIGRIKDDEAYQVDMGNGFKPFRRNIEYLEAKHLDIKPLIPLLDFIKNRSFWGYVFRYGFLEIDKKSFETITKGMLGFNPLN